MRSYRCSPFRLARAGACSSLLRLWCAQKVLLTQRAGIPYSRGHGFVRHADARSRQPTNTRRRKGRRRRCRQSPRRPCSHRPHLHRLHLRRSHLRWPRRRCRLRPDPAGRQRHRPRNCPHRLPPKHSRRTLGARGTRRSSHLRHHQVRRPSFHRHRKPRCCRTRRRSGRTRRDRSPIRTRRPSTRSARRPTRTRPPVAASTRRLPTRSRPRPARIHGRALLPTRTRRESTRQARSSASCGRHRARSAADRNGPSGHVCR